MIGVDHDKDARTGIPVTSLYGETFESLTPTAAELAEVDVLVIDLQDVGSRYYTYVWTMALAMQAAARAGVAVVVLDRPNPLGGVEVESGPARARLSVVRGPGRRARSPRPDDRRDRAPRARGIPGAHRASASRSTATSRSSP